MDASLHAMEPVNPERLDTGFLQAAQVLCRVITNQHMVFPLSIHAGRIQMLQLWPVQQYNAKVVVTMHIADESRR